MGNVSVTKSINVSAQSAWEELSSFKGIENYSPIAKSVTTGEGTGATRVCTMPDGAEIDEILNKVDNDNMHFQYAINSEPFPVTGYVSDVKVKPTGDNSCEITWACTYNSAEEVEANMNGLFGGFYNLIIDGLEGHLN
ncbi:SRPBCC family protein [Aureitalea marina]|uniref:MxaD family protein n=1 Tax=Aureitalea marina TaxID=930804 RepID=A0A2S7KRZ1_9FLAO|nr:SRPBCC family protein [Aureitalea marina]PQB05394.1 hypothetical protein BST85_11215 [Aureitalea marina]